MSLTSPLRVAIVGSGPSGCYMAQALRRASPDAEIQIFEKLVSPFGLIRYGVAPDHQHTKSIVRQFERLFTYQGVGLVGNVELGVDVSLAELQEAFTLVVLATGLTQDRTLMLPGSQPLPAIGAGDLIRQWNGYPGSAPKSEHLGERVVVVGAGNVSMDILRILAKRPADLVGSDICDEALGSYFDRPAHTITVVSRSGLDAAKFDPVMLTELGQIPGVRFSFAGELGRVSDSSARAKSRREAMDLLCDREVPEPIRLQVEFLFGWAPISYGRNLAGTQVGIQASGGEIRTLTVDSVVTAIGFQHGIDHSGFLDAESQHVLGAGAASGKVRDGLYCTGWLRRGSDGGIPENRRCAQEVAATIIADLSTGKVRPEPSQRGLEMLPKSVTDRATDFQAWVRLDHAEISAARPQRVRRKFPDHGAMRALALTND
ncbi:FAD-dependent oxidoreductase [Leucobacter sp. Z1108]|uniref:FAD-dependent oxidoreductase n=1 Tax=Leucobacter sp. Z1108 TaxID=3439066 RepID=UPI003F359B09